LKRWAKLDDAKARQEEGMFLAEGVKVVEELLKSDWRIKAFLLMPEKIKYWEKLTLPAIKIFLYINLPALSGKKSDRTENLKELWR